MKEDNLEGWLKEILTEDNDPAYLTAEEQKAVDDAGRLFTFITNEIIGHGVTRDADISELAADIHRVQHRVMAQAAARLYPGKFRLLGETISGEE